MGVSKIEWCDRVWNVVTGCTKISPGCANCYAERMAKRLSGRCGYPADEPFRVTLHPERLEEPLRWMKPSRVFVSSMGDLFHDDVSDDFIDQVFAVMALTPQHTYQVLTKRPGRMAEYFAPIGGTSRRDWVLSAMGRQLNARRVSMPPWPLPNVWLGVTAENQAQADKRIPVLLQIPAAVRFVSVEPMLGPVDLRHLHYDNIVEIDALAGTHGVFRPHGGVNEKLSWVICGGESGPGARPIHPDWARSLRDQCQAAGVPYFFKQWGEFAPVGWAHADSRGALVRPDGHVCRDRSELASSHNFEMSRIGKKKAGRLLDGVEWNEMPGVG